MTRWCLPTLLFATAYLAACAGSGRTESESPAVENVSTARTRGPARSPARPAAEADGPAEADGAAEAELPAAPRAEPCGSFTCRRFAHAGDALDYVLRVDAPRALGVGESHALAHHERITSATARFGGDLLPRLAPRTRALVVELLAPRADCTPESAEQVKQEQRQITQGQASTNQNEFVALGHRARELGVTPYILRATCEDLEAIAQAGDDAVLVMMETIARRTTLEFERHLRAGSTEAPPLVVAYGGALHNDLAPRPGREAWSYGPGVRDLTQGSYTALDLIVPEHITDSDGWRAFPWYSSIPELDEHSAVLLEVAPRSWVLFFPKTPSPSE